MLKPKMVGIDSMPKEILDQIIQDIPILDLPKVMLSSKAFWGRAEQHLYSSICDPAKSSRSARRDPRHPPILTRAHAQFNSGATIARPSEFLRTITDNSRLRSLVQTASFSTHQSGDKSDKELLQKLLNVLTPKLLHLSLANSDAHVALMNTVTSLDIRYPAEPDLQDLEDLEDPQQNLLRDQIFALFNIPSLRNLTLRDARSWCAFSPVSDNTRAGTSNVVSLSLPNTVPMDTDLQEILTWPKGLRCIYHENMVGERNDNFQADLYSRGKATSAEGFLEGIASQRGSLEELSYNNGVDCRGDDGSAFPPLAMADLVKLRYLSVPWDCLFDYSEDPYFLNTLLPTNLEVLYLGQNERMGAANHESHLKEWVEAILDRRDVHLPELKTVVLWQEKCCARTINRFLTNDYRPEELVVLERLSLVPLFAKTGVRLDFNFM